MATNRVTRTRVPPFHTLPSSTDSTSSSRPMYSSLSVNGSTATAGAALAATAR